MKGGSIMNKIYKGVIHSLLPQKGFGFITPVWANGDSEENIFFHLSETKGGKCYIPALASAENRQEVVSKKGTKTLIPNEPQVVFFELSAQELANGVKLIAKKIRDAKNVSEEEAKQADANTEKPSVDELLHPTEETINLAVTADTIKSTEEVVEEDECTVEVVEAHDNTEDVSEEEYEDEYDDEEDDDYDEYDEYDEYDNDDYYIQPSKGRKDNHKASRKFSDD